MKPTAFTVTRADRAANKEITVGTTVYDSLSYDYGVSRDDTAITGIPYTSVTLKPDGTYPFFTIPLADIRRIDAVPKKPHKGRISNWCKVSSKSTYIIIGTIEGHPDFPDDGPIRTSEVISHKDGEIETKNSRYTLIGKET